MNEFFKNIFYFWVKENIDNDVLDYDGFVLYRKLCKRYYELIPKELLQKSFIYKRALELALNSNPDNYLNVKKRIDELFLSKNINISKLYIDALENHINTPILPITDEIWDVERVFKRVFYENAKMSGAIVKLRLASPNNIYSIPHMGDLFSYLLFEEKPDYVKFNNCSDFSEGKEILYTTNFEQININGKHYYITYLSKYAIPISKIPYNDLCVNTNVDTVYCSMFVLDTEIRTNLMKANNIPILFSNGIIANVYGGQLFAYD